MLETMKTQKKQYAWFIEDTNEIVELDQKPAPGLTEARHQLVINTEDGEELLKLECSLIYLGEI